jgi:hypothetical protein
MRATKAYLAGLGTTGILIACFLLLLAVGSALIAFQGWPGVAAGDGLERVVVKNQAERAAARSGREATARWGEHAGDRRTVRAAERPARGVRRGSLRRAQQSQADGPAPATGDRSGAGPAPSQPAAGAGDVHKSAAGGGTRTQPPVAAPDVGNTVEQASGGLGETVQGTTGGLGDTVQGATGGLGDAVGGVSPGVGETVTGTGEAAGQAVEDVGQGVGNAVEDTGRTVNGVLP